MNLALALGYNHKRLERGSPKELYVPRKIISTLYLLSPPHNTLNIAVYVANYRIEGNFRGRKFLRISRICVYPRKFSPQKSTIMPTPNWQCQATYKSFLHKFL